MTATDELRRLLDGRGVEHVDAEDGHTQHTLWSDGDHEIAACNSGERLAVYNLTPEQAIAATLGNDGVGRTDDGVAERGTCSRGPRRPMAEYVYGTDGREGHWLTGEEIVRCRDCACFIEGTICGNGFIDGNPDAFCSWGERRDA